MKEKIIIFAAGGHAKVITDIIEKQGIYDIAGFIDKNYKIGDNFLDYKIISDESNLVEILKIYKKGIIAIGDNWNRYILYKKIKKINENFEFITAIHPSSNIGKGVKIGKGTVVMAGVIINPYAVIGNHCIVNTLSSIDHDVILHNFSSIAPGVTLGGGVEIGEFSAISLGAKIIHKIKIGKNAVIGAGAVVVKNIIDNVVAYGVPAKIIRSRKQSDKYL